MLLIAVIALGDISHGLEKTQYVGLLASVPFLAATFAPPRGVLLLGALAWTAGLGMGLVHEDGRGTPQAVRLACIAVAVAMACVAARSRGVRERRLVAVESAADAASRAILRPLPPVVGGVPLQVDYVSASQQSRVGGDLYEAVATPWGLRLVVGDVRGKGLEAVRLAAVVLGSFREAAHREPDLACVAAALHASVARDADVEDFVTALLVELPVTGPARMLACGHPGPLRLRGGRAEVLALPAEQPLGLAAPGPAVEVDLRPGDRVLLYTDGAVEARREGRFFDLEAAAGASLAAGPLAEGLAGLTERLQAFTAGSPADDVALLAFEVPARTARVPAPR
ncbi:MAG TPA: PP2C family protein-serine/threonine phosphatase [Mycobacteriales bacterium]|nr:PP2C family protein-serine/threonine phosphatase [Mycobacteriales bacterium]